MGWIFLAATMAIGAAFIFWLQRDLAFADDSFNWLTLTGLGPNKVLIEPYGGHLILIPLLIFKAVLGTVGVSFTAFGVIQVILLLLLSALLYEYGRRRVGPLLALPAAVIVLFLGSSWNVLLQPMLGIQFLSALVPGVAALLTLERDDRRGDIATCALLTLATWGFEMGFAFLVGAGVGIAMRSDRWRRAWVVVIPLVIYGVWRIWASQYGGAGLHLSNLLWVPAYAVDSLGVVIVSLFGLSYWVSPGQLTALKLNGFDLNHFSEGLVLLALEVLAVSLVVRRMRLRGRIPTTFWIAVAVLVTLWVEQGLALSPDRTPGEIRYIFPDTVAFLLVAVEAARGIRAIRATVVAAIGLTVVAVAGNLARFKEGRDILAEYSPPAKAAITVMVLGGSDISPDFNAAADAPEAFATDRAVYFGAGSIQQLSAKFGSPGYTIPELLSQSESVRRSADIVAAHALRIHTEPVGASGGVCHPRRGKGESVALQPGESILVSRRPSSVLARRFADHYVIEVGHVTPDHPVSLRIPGDSAAIPWRVRAPGSGSLTACPR
ncbi:MAG: hypothetical protein WBM00_12230 [Solirubrobacterales bacterium]